MAQCSHAIELLGLELQPRCSLHRRPPTIMVKRSDSESDELHSDPDDYAPGSASASSSPAKKKKKGKRSKITVMDDAYQIKNVLKAPRPTTYSTQALHRMWALFF